MYLFLLEAALINYHYKWYELQTLKKIFHYSAVTRTEIRKYFLSLRFKLYILNCKHLVLNGYAYENVSLLSD